MKKFLSIVLLTLSTVVTGQDCSPFRKVPSYELSKNKSAALGYVACIHATGILAEVGYSKVFGGVLVMGVNHNNSAYTFLQYEERFKRFTLYGGPAYRLNNESSILIGRIGTDIRLYKRIWFTGSLLQINRRLNYSHFGLKVVI